jgi:hypothetical protein
MILNVPVNFQSEFWYKKFITAFITMFVALIAGPIYLYYLKNVFLNRVYKQGEFKTTVMQI